MAGLFNLILLLLFLALCVYSNDQPLIVSPNSLELEINGNASVEYKYREHIPGFVKLTLKTSSQLSFDSNIVTLTQEHNSSVTKVTGQSLTSRIFIYVDKCLTILNGSESNCTFDYHKVLVRVSVFKSYIISWFVYITGWICFFAWSISFYPQIILNYQRKSVVGLNFDFLLLNVIGFFCYTVFNVMFYFSKRVQNIYIQEHLHNLIPVLFNDVVFAVHALIVCIVTGAQCFFYERGTQRVSYLCLSLSSLLISFVVVLFFITLFALINWLQFITMLSYVKMFVTLSKYLPQAIFNYKKKSTVGWSIGNIILDFLGGIMNTFQMILQALNTNDWSAFFEHPVKFGLGFVSIFFDVIFIIQHYVLYRPSDDQTEYDEVRTAENTVSNLSLANDIRS